MDRGTCETCGYTVTPKQTICPECGKPIDWERQRSLSPSPRPESAIATGIACLLALVLTWVTGTLCTVQPSKLALGMFAMVGLQALIIAGFGAMVRIADMQHKGMERWWVALAPVSTGPTVAFAPYFVFDWAMRGGAPAPGDAQWGIYVALFCIVLNAFTILSAAATAGVLWGLLLFQKRLRWWPTWNFLGWAVGIPIALLMLLATVNPITAAQAAVILVLPIAVPPLIGLIVAPIAVPAGARGAQIGDRSHAVQPTVILAILLSTFACALYNFWWLQTCINATL